GAALAMPGGPGWPETEVVVTLRRIGTGDEESPAPDPDILDGESGRFGTVYNLYESDETILLLADPRVRRDYFLQDVPEAGETADEKGQCRRCDWPSYLPDPKDGEAGDPELDKIKELLAGGRYLRVFLFPTTDSSQETKERTEEAIAYFEAQGENYPLPSGWARVAAPADAVPSPLQASLAEPAQNPAIWKTGEARVEVSLSAGEALLTANDHLVGGRGLPFAFDRTYRSGMLGYGALGSAGWSADTFAHLREIETTGEVEYHDGAGHVWRFYPRTAEEVPDDYEDDPAGSYYAAPGVYLRLQRLSGDTGWRLLGRQHDSLLFDADGRLIEASDRLRRQAAANEQGSTIFYRYDPFGQLVTVEDDLGRRYRFEYHDDPRPESQGGDGVRYGLLDKITDFHDRTIEYEYDDDRTLRKVRLPEVSNPLAEYAVFSYEGSNRPTVEYQYDPSAGVTSNPADTTAILHGEFAQLRLGSYFMPDFVPGVSGVPRVRFEYVGTTGRLASVSFPTPDNQNSAAAGVEWQLDYLDHNADAAPATRVTMLEPWGHDVGYVLGDGRVVEIREELEIVPAAGDPYIAEVGPQLLYADDGRLVSVTQPDGGRRVNCYPDGTGRAVAGGIDGCPDGDEIDRLALANVMATVDAATTPDSQGGAEYASIVTATSYQEDNMPVGFTDGVGRSIGMPLPAANATARLQFNSEGVSGSFDLDAHGRLEQYTGGGEGGPVMRAEYGADAGDRQGAGLLKRKEQGGLGEVRFWEEREYDDAYNLEERRTSYGTYERSTYDLWDRMVRSVGGLSDGRFQPVGTEECSEARGSVFERAFDAVGHVVRERRLQDYVDAGGTTRCRWVEKRYIYNAREQVVAVEQTYLASALEPGLVVSASQRTMEAEYDTFGRLARQKSLNQLNPHLVTSYRYDDAGRTVGVKVGETVEQVTGYDENSRMVVSSDGDEGTWRGRYDAWDRLYHEELATGAVVRRQFDEASNPMRATVWNADPTSDPEAELLSDVRSHFTSFGELERMVEVLAADGDGGESEVRVTEQVFDQSGRVIGVWSGPPLPDSDRLDASQARREIEIEYEQEAGRVKVESFGGSYGEAPEYAQRYDYYAENAAPWADAITYEEAVPGEVDRVDTFTTTYARDALGRPIREQHSDGRLIHTAYDRTGGAIRVRTGAGTTSSVGFDSRGLPVRQFRPNNRGVTTYAYDLDGRLLHQSSENASGSHWDTTFGYDATGRVVRVDYPDGTFTSATYNADNTVATQRTRDGLEVSFGYDAANRLASAVPSANGGVLPASLEPLDVGTFYDYDVLSRITSVQRGSAGGSAPDPALSVSYPSYDLASRPAVENVGGRASMGWKYDLWDRPVEVTLPAGTGSQSGGNFTGFRRDYDTVDRLADVSGLGQLTSTPLGATWSWGGTARLYGIDTRGSLGTAARYGYLAGRGAQPPGSSGDGASRWRLGTVSWGSTAGDPVATATQAPGVVWGQFGFGWRGNDGDQRDGTKIGRMAVDGLNGGGLDLFAGLGWSWQYDAGVRLSYAAPGRGDIQGRAPPAGTDSFRYQYGKGDELERIIREADGNIAELTVGVEGRITHRDGIPFAYDAVGRRTEDDRFVYRRTWRGELATATVKDSWPDGEVSPFAGHQIRYHYDALGRLLYRWHLAELPD
ncbi:MAG: RHS repeat protein, partial [bacterium]|nr:RHS repeat protein [bacterium]